MATSALIDNSETHKHFGSAKHPPVRIKEWQFCQKKEEKNPTTAELRKDLFILIYTVHGLHTETV